MLTRILSKAQWIVDHPLELIGLLAIVFCLAYLIGALVMALMLSHEEQKAEQQREAFEQIMRASTPPKGWPPKAGPKGFDRSRRVS